MFSPEAVNSDEDAASMDEANHAATLLWPGLQQVLADLPDTTSSNTTDTTSRDTPDFDSRVALGLSLEVSSPAPSTTPMTDTTPKHQTATRPAIHTPNQRQTWTFVEVAPASQLDPARLTIGDWWLLGSWVRKKMTEAATIAASWNAERLSSLVYPKATIVDGRLDVQMPLGGAPQSHLTYWSAYALSLNQHSHWNLLSATLWMLRPTLMWTVTLVLMPILILALMMTIWTLSPHTAPKTMDLVMRDF